MGFIPIAKLSPSRLHGEAYERLVVEVEDPEGAVERINRAVGALPRAAGTA